MAGNSGLRRVAKRALAPVLNERTYRYVQAVSMARDIRAGRLDEPEMDLIAAAVRPGDTVLDVGANYGSWARRLSGAVGGNGSVLCFEPIPFTADVLETVTRLLRLGNVTVDRRGCSDASGTVTFEIPVQDNGAISAGQSHIAGRSDDRQGREQHARWTQTREVTCPVVSLDEVVGDREVTFAKLDIEGAELRALQGARRLLERSHPTLVLEINPWFLEGFGLATTDLTGYLDGLGYELFRYSGSALQPVTAAEIDEDNYVAWHPSRELSVG